MIGIIYFLLLISFNCSNEIEDMHTVLSHFEKFNEQHNKKYSSHYEVITKLRTFSQNLKFVNRHDKYSPFMDLDDAQFSKRLGLKHNTIPIKHSKLEDFLSLKQINYEDDEKELDYRKEGAVSSVIDQGECGSCWAFSTIGMIEGQVKLLYYVSTKLSIQELLDCDNITFDDGCNGGSMADALYFLITKKYGVMTEKDYPYKALRNERCFYNPNMPMFFVDSFMSFNNTDEDGLKSLLRVNGPISITINASSWKYYIDGIYRPNSKTCDPKTTNHAVLLIGYGTEGDVDYWIIKNSWGTSWGEDGYIRLERGINACGITENAYIAQMKQFKNTEEQHLR